MKKNGFTLIELVITVAIMLALVGIAVPSTISLVNKSKNKSRDLQIEEFLSSAENYVIDNKSKWNMSSIGTNTYCFSLDDLVVENYIKEIPIDPVTEEKFIGSINIFVKDSKINYEYSEDTCNNRLVDAGLVDNNNNSESENNNLNNTQYLKNKLVKDHNLKEDVDKDGKTYYAYNPIYIKIGDMDMLRVFIRVNGDSTIRLVSNDI